MLDSQNRLQNYFKNAKTIKFLLELAFYTSEGRTCKVLSFYDFWFRFNDKFCSSYPIVDFYAYLITKIGNRNLNKTKMAITEIKAVKLYRNHNLKDLSSNNWPRIFSKSSITFYNVESTCH